MGWNQVIFKKDVPIFEGIANGSFFYFVHSYFVEPALKSDIATETEYGVTFTSSIARNNIFALQFHPEKSQENGLKVLRNFSSL